MALTLIFSLLFVGGLVAYWIVSTPLKDLPNWHELNPEASKSSKPTKS